jgi:hypothetical protein
MAVETRRKGDDIDTKSRPEKEDFAQNSPSDEGVSALIEVNERKVLRKIDRRIVPLMFACYCLQYLDKTLGKFHRPPEGHNTNYSQSITPMLWAYSKIQVSMATNSLS